MNNEESKGLKERANRKTGAIIGLSIVSGILLASTIGLGIAYGVEQSTLNNYGTSLENIYQKNLYDLTESVNNLEIKLSKVLASNSSSIRKKLLVEVSNNADLAQSSISSLPISQGAINDTIRFVNQVGGYTKTLAEGLSEGKTMSQQDLDTLSAIRDNIVEMKAEINKFTKKTQQQYSILNESLNFNENSNSFTSQIGKMQKQGVDYPTMIYDGPFSDSQLAANIKGLPSETVSKDEAYQEVSKTFKNVANLDYCGEMNSKFSTYNFELTTTSDQMLFVQVVKNGGHVLTVSGNCEAKGAKSIDMATAKKIALEFARENGIEDAEVVWSDTLKNAAYLNIAPKENGIILYPDLVKVKVDMTNGTVIGYDATGYFTNHTERALGDASVTSSQANAKVPNGYEIKQTRLVLAPLDYSREVLCMEVECEKGGATYYFYYNAKSGEEENILKVIQTSDGSKLM